MAVSAATIDSSRVGGDMESAHAILAGLDPAHEIGFALAMGKLMTVHLNDQNGIKYDQDKAFGVENLRAAFNQVKVLKENGYGGSLHQRHIYTEDVHCSAAAARKGESVIREVLSGDPGIRRKAAEGGVKTVFCRPLEMNVMLHSLARNESTTATNRTLKKDIREVDDEDIDPDTISGYLERHINGIEVHADLVALGGPRNYNYSDHAKE